MKKKLGGCMQRSRGENVCASMCVMCLGSSHIVCMHIRDSFAAAYEEVYYHMKKTEKARGEDLGGGTGA